MELSEKQWAIIYAALLETSAEVIMDSLGGTEYGSIGAVTEDDVDELYHIAQEQCGAHLPQ